MFLRHHVQLLQILHKLVNQEMELNWRTTGKQYLIVQESIAFMLTGRIWQVN